MKKIFPFFIGITLLSLMVVFQINSGRAVSQVGNFRWDEEPIQGFEALRILKKEKEVNLSSGPVFDLFWWNICQSKFEKETHDSLSNNLIEIRKKLKPTFVVFGEYTPESFQNIFSKVEIDEWNKTYPYSVYLPYNQKNPDLGIGVFSQVPFSIEKNAALSWTPDALKGKQLTEYVKKWTIKDDSAKYMDRTYNLLKLNFAGKNIFISPVHLVMPWNHLTETKGKLVTAKTLVLDEESPLKNQLDHLESLLEEDIKNMVSKDEELIVVGDFNLPKKLLVPTSGFKSWNRILKESFDEEIPTFPAFSAPERMKLPYLAWPLKIDHLFVKKDRPTPRAAILPLAGSDHYPIYSKFIVKMAPKN